MQKSKKKSTKQSKRITSSTTQARTSKLQIPDKPISREVKKRRLKGSIAIPVETVGLMFTNLLLVVEMGGPVRIANLFSEIGKNDAEVEKIRPQIEQIMLKACDLGADLTSHAYNIRSLYKNPPVTAFVLFAYYIIRSSFEKQGKVKGKSATKAENDEIMELIWKTAEYFPGMRKHISAEKIKGEESFKAWQKDMRKIAVEQYKTTTKNERNAQTVKAEVFQYLTKLLGVAG